MPLPANAAAAARPLTPERVALGRRLFSDTRLSKAGGISCNTCHNLETYGVDNKAVSSGHEGQVGNRNSPTVYNAALHFVQFWDGRAKDVEEQALGPILNPSEMAMGSSGEAIERLKSDPSTVAQFKSAFPNEKDPVTFDNIGLAIGAFERTLITPSRFDQFLKGDANSLTDAEKAGGKLFVESGCIACHNGALLGGGTYQKLGLVRPYPTKDKGRFEVTKVASDEFMFKVPSLRNVEKTAPYFHDGSVKTLPEAITLMGRHQLGRELSAEDTSKIETFLRALTAEKLPK
jgi:cytochrome c peroxidase